MNGSRHSGVCVFMPLTLSGGAVCAAHLGECAHMQICVREACDLQLQCEQQQCEF